MNSTGDQKGISMIVDKVAFRISRRAAPLLVSIAFIAMGCAAPQEHAKRRYFWPAPPDEPKVEFLTAYWGGADMPRTAGQRFMESLVGSEDISLARPWGVVSDGEGKIYVTDINAAAVVLFDIKNGKVSYMGGPEMVGSFENPIGVALDAAGNIYVSDSKKKMVFVYDKDERPLRTIGDKDTLGWPVGLAIDDKLGRLYVADTHGHRVQVFDLSGKHLLTIGGPGGRDGRFRYPNTVALAPDGNIVVADTMNARVQVMDREGNFVRTMGVRGDGPTDLQLPTGIGVSKAGHIYVTDGRGNKVVVFSMEGERLTAMGEKFSYRGAAGMKLMPGGFLQPTGLFIDKNDTIYVADSLNARLQVFQELNEEYLRKNPIPGQSQDAREGKEGGEAGGQ